jgi:hypothetical protein
VQTTASDPDQRMPDDSGTGRKRMRNPPILISVLGFFGALAGFYWLYLGLRLLGFDWFGIFGDVPKFEQTGLWGWLAIAGGIAWIAAAGALWSLRPWGWLFAMIMAGISLFEAFLWFLDRPGSGVGFGAAVMPLVIIWYLNTREVKAAFGLDTTAR